MRRVAAAAVVVLAAAAPGAAARDRTQPAISDFSVANGGPPFHGDGRLLTTITPNGDGLRETATISFRLSEPARVVLSIARTTTAPIVVYRRAGRLGRGRHTLAWSPIGLNPRTYIVLLTATDRSGNRTLVGPTTARAARRRRTPVIRVLGIDAGFTRPGYAPGEIAALSIATDARSLVLQLFRAGPERKPTYADNAMNGVPVTEPHTLRWRPHRDAPRTLRLRIPALPTGVYFAQLTAPTGDVGYAPFVLRPAVLGRRRIAVVIPTNTWQAYNFRDEDGDGYGETWYAGPPHQTVRLGRPYLRRGVPPQFRKYDLGVLHWLSWTRKEVDYLSDADLEGLDGRFLSQRYDLIVFGGHEEYVTQHVFDAITHYRDLGGNLAFLSANNFFWRVERKGGTLRRDRLFRKLGRPEAALVGVQYRASDDGRKQRPFRVRSEDEAPWLWEKTGLGDGSTFGDFVGGFGIEIDARTSDSPPGTTVLAEIPDLYGPGFTAEMTYYETRAGAKVFAAGALDFGGHATVWPLRRVLANLWARLSEP